MPHTLVTLVGEQPLPALLVSRHVDPERTVLLHTEHTRRVAQRLEELIPQAELLCLEEPYDLGHLRGSVLRALRDGEETVFDLTGGTKPMALALYGLAQALQVPFVYLQTERYGSRLHYYVFEDTHRAPVLHQKLRTPDDLLTIGECLRAYLGSYRNDPPEGPDGDSAGLAFEAAVIDGLRACCDEVEANVRADGPGERSVELDAVFRRGHRLGVAEIGLAKKKHPKQGLEQIALATWPTVLGTYTAPFLILAGRLGSIMHELARSRRIEVVELVGYWGWLMEGVQATTLPESDLERLRRAITQRMG